MPLLNHLCHHHFHKVGELVSMLGVLHTLGSTFLLHYDQKILRNKFGRADIRTQDGGVGSANTISVTPMGQLLKKLHWIQTPLFHYKFIFL